MDFDILNAASRRRLRVSVDVQALELLLSTVPTEARTGVYLACVADPTPQELVALGVLSADDLTDLDLLGEQGKLEHLSSASVDLQLRFAEPRLAAMWAAVEPGAP